MGILSGGRRAEESLPTLGIPSKDLEKLNSQAQCSFSSVHFRLKTLGRREKTGDSKGE